MLLKVLNSPITNHVLSLHFTFESVQRLFFMNFQKLEIQGKRHRFYTSKLVHRFWEIATYEKAYEANFFFRLLLQIKQTKYLKNPPPPRLNVSFHFCWEKCSRTENMLTSTRKVIHKHTPMKTTVDYCQYLISD